MKVVVPLLSTNTMGKLLKDWIHMNNEALKAGARMSIGSFWVTSMHSNNLIYLYRQHHPVMHISDIISLLIHVHALILTTAFRFFRSRADDVRRCVIVLDVSSTFSRICLSCFVKLATLHFLMKSLIWKRKCWDIKFKPAVLKTAGVDQNLDIVRWQTHQSLLGNQGPTSR